MKPLFFLCLVMVGQALSASEQGTISGEGVRLRKEPNGGIMGKLRKGAAVSVLGRTEEIGGHKGTWFQVKTAEGAEGWVFGRYVALAPAFKLEDLQGAWWSDFSAPTADFGIQGQEVWLDYDAEYHPCRIEGDVLIFDLGPELGPVKNKILSLEGDRLVLEHHSQKEPRVLTRVKE